VVCESIDRISRITYVGTKIEYELEQAALQTRFVANVNEQRIKIRLLDGITRGERDRSTADLDLIDALPTAAIDVTLLPEPQQRLLFDAFHLELRYDKSRHELVLRVTIYAEAAGGLVRSISQAIDEPTGQIARYVCEGSTDSAVGYPVGDVLRAPGRSHRASTQASRAA
jgi:hypothetical protein